MLDHHLRDSNVFLLRSEVFSCALQRKVMQAGVGALWIRESLQGIMVAPSVVLEER